MIDNDNNDIPNFNYKNTPAYRRKLKREERKKAEKAGLMMGQGPITIILIYLFDLIIKIISSLFNFIFSFTSLGFGSVYDVFYGAYDGIIPNSEKFGTVISMKPLRMFITLLIPPVGIFLSKGLYGWFNILLCFGLTYIHFILGVIYAFVITFRNRYADRYEEIEYKRIMMIREYIKSCTGKEDKIITTNKEYWSFILVILLLLTIFTLLYYAFKFM